MQKKENVNIQLEEEQKQEQEHIFIGDHKLKELMWMQLKHYLFLWI